MIGRKQLWALAALTLMWGVNWPMMKYSLREMTPLYFRALTMSLGATWLFVFYLVKGVPMWPRGRQWGSILALGLPNMLGWHTASIMGVRELASGRAAILGFTMPIWTVLLGALFLGEPLTRRLMVAAGSVAAAIALLLLHETVALAGRPLGIAWMQGAALAWAVGTLMMRRLQSTLAVEALTVWMLILASICLWVLALALEPWPDWNFTAPLWASLAYGVFINYGFAQIIWFGMARNLPAATSAMSVMAVPLVGTLSATLIVGEKPHWEDFLAMLFVMGAIAAVLLPRRTPPPTPPR